MSLESISLSSGIFYLYPFVVSPFTVTPFIPYTLHLRKYHNDNEKRNYRSTPAFSDAQRPQPFSPNTSSATFLLQKPLIRNTSSIPSDIPLSSSDSTPHPSGRGRVLSLEDYSERMRAGAVMRMRLQRNGSILLDADGHLLPPILCTGASPQRFDEQPIFKLNNYAGVTYP
ncbi:hypothetical protein BU17DRAFT_100054 [Hysterangium stoloniferum]|nr:hypothetical protein BU17DRAFT_100054 [Hysterangium stoloniferum]